MSDVAYNEISLDITGDNAKAVGSLDETISFLRELKSLVSDIKRNSKINIKTSTTYTARKGKAKSAVEEAVNSVTNTESGVNTSIGRSGDIPDATDAGSSASDIKDMVKNMQNLRSVLSTAWNGFIQGAQSALKISYKFSSSFFKTLGDLAKQGFGRLTEGIRSSMTAVNSFLKSIGRIALYRAIRSAIKEVTASIKEGIENLYRWSRLNDGEFANSMNRLATESLHVKNALGAALAPVINAMVPIVERLAHAFINVVNAINQFFSALAGATTWTKALHTPITYAQAAGSGFDKAKKKAKEYKATILGFDEINRLNDNTDSNSGSGSGSGTELPYGSMFEKQNLDSFWKDWLNKHDWTGLGEMFASKLNTVVDAVDDWILTKARPWAMKWSTRIATFLNGFVTGFNWQRLGKTVADGLNTVFYAVNNFFTRFDAMNFGKGIAKTIHGWFYNTDWKALGRYLSNKLNFIIDSVDGFFSEFSKNARSYGTMLGTAFNTWVNSIHWDNLRSGLSNGLKSIADYIWGFLDNTDGSWDRFSEQFSNTLSSIFGNPDLGRLMRGIGEMVNRIVELLGTVDWKEVGHTVGSAIASIDWKSFLMTAVSAIADMFVGCMEELFGSENGRAFLGTVAAVATIGGVFNVAKLGLTSVISSFASNIGTTLATHLATAMGSAGSVGAASLAGPIGLAIAGVSAAVVSAVTHWDELKQMFDVIGERLKAGSNLASSTVQLQAALAAKGVKVSIADVESYLDGTMSVLELTGGKFSTLAEIAQSSMSSVESDTAKAVTGISNSAGVAHQKLQAMNTDIGKNMREAGSGFNSGLNTMGNGMKTFADKIKSAFDTIGSNIRSMFSSLSSAASSAINSIQGFYNSVSSSVSRAISSVRNIRIPAHAEGTPAVEDGLFYANHTELVGRFTNGKTAVANNDQIVAGIEQGVFNAVSSALKSMPSDNGDVVLVIDSEEVARASIRGQRNLDRRFNPTVKFTG